MTILSRLNRSPVASANRGKGALLWISFALFAVLAFISTLGETTATDRAYDPASLEAQGTRILWLWMEELGYDVAAPRQSRVPGDQVALLMLFPSPTPFAKADAERLYQWVEGGKTLVLIGLSTTEAALTAQFGVSQRPDLSLGLSVEQPLLGPLSARHFETLTHTGPSLELSEAPGAVAVLAGATGADVTRVAVQQIGDGTVWHLTSDFDFQNRSLQSDSDRYLLPAILRHVPDGATVMMDTGSIDAATAVSSVRGWFYGTALGRSLLIAALAGLLFLIVQGIRLGPPLPAIEETRRREAAEYVEAMAALKRRARQERAVAAYHKRRLKKELGRAYHIAPDLPDGEYLDRLARVGGRYGPAEIQELSRLMKALDHSLDAAALVGCVNDVDKLVLHKRR